VPAEADERHGNRQYGGRAETSDHNMTSVRDSGRNSAPLARRHQMPSPDGHHGAGRSSEQHRTELRQGKGEEIALIVDGRGAPC